jgi:polyribonucleotide nucleotidyltransferase
MENATSVTINVDGKDITIEAGLLAQQAAGAVSVTMGETVLFSAVTCTKEPREGIDYFPLQVEYREKFYAAGRFPGGFFKREARPGEKEILTSRITDRPIRPLFPPTYRNDVQINNMLLSADGVNDSDMLSIIASSAALTISEIPFKGPIAAVRVGRVDGKFVINPTNEERETSDIDLVYASTRDLPLMIEGGGKEIPEADLLAAMKFGHVECEKLIDAQLELRSKLGLPEKVIVEEEADTTILDSAREVGGADMAAVMLIAGKEDRDKALNEIRSTLKEKLQAKHEEMTVEQYRSAFDELEIEVVRSTCSLSKNTRHRSRSSTSTAACTVREHTSDS